MTDIQEHPVAPPKNCQVWAGQRNVQGTIQRQVSVALEPVQARIILHATQNKDIH